MEPSLDNRQLEMLFDIAKRKKIMMLWKKSSV